MVIKTPLSSTDQVKEQKDMWILDKENEFMKNVLTKFTIISPIKMVVKTSLYAKKEFFH